MATQHLDLGNETISFEARFSGVPRVVRFPVAAVLSIYARESGEGMVFPPEGELASPADLLAPRTSQAPTVPAPTSPVRGRPNLTVVK
jgi:stringent starvation protein B